MSWQLFKNNILSVIKTGDALNSVDDMATLYATEYDKAIKNGGDTINKIRVKNGNLQLLIQLFKVNFYTGQASMVPYDWVGGMKPGILAYWQGAELEKAPIPIIPAIGSIVNIQNISGIVTTPGDWQPGTPLPPNDNPNLIIDAFIINAIAHLQTVSGIINTISLYPPLGTPGPGIVNWSGYFVPPASPDISIMVNEPSTDELLETMRNMFDLSSRYIILGEYFSRTPIMINYRGDGSQIRKYLYKIFGTGTGGDIHVIEN
jgi:hypothetical protein